MSMLFYIDERNKCVLRPECYKLSPTLAKLSEEEILWLVLSYDYHSIFRQFPEQDRIRRAMFHVWDDNMPKLLKDKRILDAIEVYKSLQYDSNLEQVQRLNKKIDSLMDKLDEDDSPTSNKNTLLVIKDLKQSIRDIENEVVSTMKAEGQIKGGKELSFLEKMMKNQKIYAAVTEAKK